MTAEMLQVVKPTCDFQDIFYSLFGLNVKPQVEIFTTSVPSSLADLCDLCLLYMWQLLRHVQDERGV